MAAIARVVSRAFHATHATSIGNEVFKQIAMFCGAALLVSLILMTYGLDLSPGFF
jgi:hypothetical protein